MSPTEFRALCISPRCTLREALEQMNTTAHGILLMLREDGTLRRTLTDGDLRRALLGNIDGAQSLATLPEQPPVVIQETDGITNPLSLMNHHQIDHIPILNHHGVPIDVISRRELSDRVWLSTPHLGDDETEFVADAFRSNWIAPLGPHVDGFERELAEYVGMAHAAAVNSGTAAIHIGLRLLGVQPGDLVFCSTLTFIGSCNPILYCGATPVFIDSEPTTWNMSAGALMRAFEWAQREHRMPRCVVIVNLYGQSADMDILEPVCRHYGVPILEDAAESLGAYYKGRASGTFGQLGVFSFNGNKIITTSGGGMLMSSDPALVARARKLSTQSREPGPHYEHAEIGYNYRMSNVLAGIGRGQLKVLEQRVAQRRRVFDIYRNALSDMPQVQWMPEPSGYRSTRWLSCFTLEGGNRSLKCKYVLRALERHSIEARPVWKPMHLQPLFREARYFSHSEGVDVSARLFESGICLPSGSNLTDEQIARVIDHLRRALSQAEEFYATA